jgi:predicted O-methyltransferase YrrM
MEALLRAARPDDIVGGVYPYRRAPEDWPPDMPVRMKPGAETEGGLLEVEGLPTGFMAIGRRLLERMALRATTFDTKTQRHVPRLFYRRPFDRGQMGGDIGFCFDARADLDARCFALPELRLGHVGKQVIWASLAHVMRMREGRSLRHVCDRIAAGTWQVQDMTEVLEDQNNRWGAREASLAFCVGMAKKRGGPILELGSGLSTVLMAAAIPDGGRVYAYEHSEEHALRTRRLAREAGVADRIALVRAPIVDGWYARDDFEALPDRFSLAFVDGPPRHLANRAAFFDALADRCEAVICDDADSLHDAMTAYADRREWEVLAHEGQAMMIGKAQTP